ncbi:contact-dependent growth inhibition system immunity protein [Lacipirellula parvula]|uniref:CdiI immunity protein domain-containing protein n=1 Tax=Lacipirellula parvula TaxID=2650471 RepID=A0A5K7XCZ7_9BACT|nr:hypothetical protein PLANPX_3950 [Lacipirellula parvula]
MAEFKDHQLLRDFFSAYYHEDWDADHHDAAGVIREYINEGRNPSHLSALADAIADLVRRAGNDVDLEDCLLRSLGCYYMPSSDGLSASEWLTHILQILRQR